MQASVNNEIKVTGKIHITNEMLMHRKAEEHPVQCLLCNVSVVFEGQKGT